MATQDKIGAWIVITILGLILLNFLSAPIYTRFDSGGYIEDQMDCAYDGFGYCN